MKWAAPFLAGGPASFIGHNLDRTFQRSKSEEGGITSLGRAMINRLFHIQIDIGPLRSADAIPERLFQDRCHKAIFRELEKAVIEVGAKFGLKQMGIQLFHIPS